MTDAVSALQTQVQTQSQTSATGFNADFKTFLTLLTTQLQNQDPLNPTDTAEFTNQLVLYSQTEQQIRTNSQLEKLVALSQNRGASEVLGYIGNDVSFIGDTIYSEGTASPHEFTMNLQDVPFELAVNIVNSEGQVVSTIDAERNAGNQKLSWDGRNSDGDPVEEGLYTIQIVATDFEGGEVATGTRVSASVLGIENNVDDDSYFLSLSGNRLIDLESILSVRIPTNFSNNTTTQNSIS